MARPWTERFFKETGKPRISVGDMPYAKLWERRRTCVLGRVGPVWRSLGRSALRECFDDVAEPAAEQSKAGLNDDAAVLCMEGDFTEAASEKVTLTLETLDYQYP